jgi:hypothetical protein
MVEGPAAEMATKLSVLAATVSPTIHDLIGSTPFPAYILLRNLTSLPMPGVGKVTPGVAVKGPSPGDWTTMAVESCWP